MASLKLMSLMSILVGIGVSTVAVAADPTMLPRQPGAPDLYITIVHAQANEPTPVAVLLHGGAGLNKEQTDSFSEWSNWLRDRGVSSLVVDSQRGRHLSGAAFDGNIEHYRALLRDRAVDVQRAVKWLTSIGWADPQRIFLLGQSQGAAAAYVSALENGVTMPQVLLYPPCGTPSRTSGLQSFPRSLWLLAEYDELAPVRTCITMRAGFIRAGAPSIDLVVIPKAYHAFDFPMDRPGTYLGKRVEFNPAARDQARAETERFLRSTAYIR